jgi:hypothetical protein
LKRPKGLEDGISEAGFIDSLSDPPGSSIIKIKASQAMRSDILTGPFED